MDCWVDSWIVAPHYTRKTFSCTDSEGHFFFFLFLIRLRSVQDVQDFVALATSRPFLINVRDEYNKINAQSFMELFCLNFSQPLRVVADCTEAELESLMRDAERFLAE